MKRVESLVDLRVALTGLRRESAHVGFVPTMGALHAGHASLLSRSRKENKVSVLSLFVNPTQFDDPKDFEKYPSTLERDLEMAIREGVDLVWVPKADEIYQDGYRFRICESQDSLVLEGRHRPGHFDGVLTVVTKLLHAVSPERAYFGEKDFQQLKLVKDLCSALLLDIEIVPCPTLRESDGLAMSSRNMRLTPEDRKLAPRFFECLNLQVPDLEVANALSAEGFEVDYVESKWGRRLGAVRLPRSEIRLIDNIELR